MSRRRYEQVEHTSDICIHAFGKDVNEIFANAAYALFDLQYKMRAIQTYVAVPIDVTAPEPEIALVRLLSELLYWSEKEEMVFKEFEVRCEESEGEITVSCIARGEPLDASRHGKGVLVKAISYHMLEIDREKGMATIVFDK